MLETWVQFQGWEDCLKKGMTSPSSMLAWRIPWVEEPSGLLSMDCRVRHDWATNTFTLHHHPGGTSECLLCQETRKGPAREALWGYRPREVRKKLLIVPQLLHLASLHTLCLQGERVTGRKARGLQTEEIGCKSQTFFLSSGRRKQTTSDKIFFLFSIQNYTFCVYIYPYIYIYGFPHSLVGRESTCNEGDLGSIPGLGRSPGEGNGNPLQYCLEKPMDKGAWQASLWGCKSRKWLSD